MTYLIQNGFITTQTQIIFKKKRITMKALKMEFLRNFTMEIEFLGCIPMIII